jgi:hypothetical protein
MGVGEQTHRQTPRRPAVPFVVTIAREDLHFIEHLVSVRSTVVRPPNPFPTGMPFA